MKIAGYCPMGCGHTLNLEKRNDCDRIVCIWPECPRPAAAHEILIADASAKPTHTVVLTVEDFSMEHPLQERLDGELFDCPLHKWLSSLDGPPNPPGRYRVWAKDNDEGWCFVEIGS